MPPREPYTYRIRIVGTLVIAAFSAIAILIAYAVIARFVLHGPVNDSSLATSVVHASGSANDPWPGVCRRGTAVRQWDCEVTDSGSSGTAIYHVQVDDDSSCWSAALVRSGEEMPEAVDGCVHRWQWKLLSIL